MCIHLSWPMAPLEGRWGLVPLREVHWMGFLAVRPDCGLQVLFWFRISCLQVLKQMTSHPIPSVRLASVRA